MENRVGIRSKKYPYLLKQIKDPPKEFYYKGTWDQDVFDRCVAVVGSRKMTRYGRDVTEKVVENLVSCGFRIVSGFMYGVDATSHEACLNSGGRTIAVMPCGIDVVHPNYQNELYNQIIDNGGLIVSEYEGTFPPAIWTYPRRNRIIAGLSLATIVIEAGDESGSLITASHTLNNHRKVFAIPGSIFSKVSVGTNRLIKNGAIIVTDFSTVSDYLLSRVNNNKQGQGKMFRKLDGKEKLVYDQIQSGEDDIDTISRSCDVEIPFLNVLLTNLQVDGFIREEEGKFYAN